MAIIIRNPKIEQLAHEAAEQSGKDITQVITQALGEYLYRLHTQKNRAGVFGEINEMSKRWSRNERSIWGIMSDSVTTRHLGCSAGTRGGVPPWKQ